MERHCRLHPFHEYCRPKHLHVCLITFSNEIFVERLLTDFIINGLNQIEFFCLSYSDNHSDVKEIIKAFRQLYIQGRSLNMSVDTEEVFLEGDTYDITVSRRDIFNSTVDELSAPSFNPCLPLKVSFMGEKGQDLGGPRKEFLRMALDSVHNRLTNGPAKSRERAPDQAGYIERKVYLVAGLVIG